MPFNHIYFNQGSQFGAMLRDLLRTLERGDDLFSDVRDVMIQMLDGDGSADAHYTEIAKRFGFGDYDITVGGAPSALALSKAHSAFDELDSAYSKTSGNGSVSSVRAARDQLFAKLRG